jgi:transcription-repair coupling factor (superfamily II helicase)
VVRLPLPSAAWAVRLLMEDLGRPALVLAPGEGDLKTLCEAARLFGAENALSFPSPSLTPYQETEISLAVRAQEAVALDRIARISRDGDDGRTFVAATPRALFRRLPRPPVFAGRVRELAPDDDVDLGDLTAHLLRSGYRRADLVTDVGDFAVRGGIFDLYPPGEDDPLRLDFFGDTLESIRRFDPVSQRSEERLDVARIVPLLPFPAGASAAEALGEALAERMERMIEETGAVSDEGRRRIEQLRTEGGFDGWESWLPALDAYYGGTEADGSLLDYLPGALVVAVDPVALESEVEHHGATLAAEYRARHEQRRPVPAPEELEHPQEWVERVLGEAAVRLRDLLLKEDAEDPDPPVDFHASATDLFHGQLPRFPQEVKGALARGETVRVVTPAAHRERLEELLRGREVPVGPPGGSGVELMVGELERGFRLPALRLSVYGEQQLLPRARLQMRSSRKRQARYGPFVSSLRDLKVGDHVVHQDHGIGRFVGLRTVDLGDPLAGPLPPSLQDGRPATPDRSEVMEIEYAGAKRLLLPLTRIDQIQKFSGIEGAMPRLDKLGGTSWNRTKARVKRGLRDMAGELVKLYAERQMAEAPPMSPDSDMVRQFAAAFSYEETPDQLDAIQAIGEDLQRSRPMDRLLCGDVGYGKTEVAMRAAFKAVDSGYQVAVLAPTTVLADQHLETFRARFDGFPVHLEMVSRFRQPAEVKVITGKLAEGKIDILIGTHRLLSKDMTFKNLGLVIVDEEQRFGVAQKERLKKVKKDVHVLAMSATPVPRTLQMSLAEVRDLSVIETPPKDRMAVETAILPFSADLVKEAIDYELERGGQVYYVYNRVDSIEEMQTRLRKLVPEARITVGHGQLDEQELSRRMHAFKEGEYDILLATTIIENGIDIPNVNTMIVHQAERFGLAQLYQLRGRVGRSDQLAYCYLLVPSDKILTEQARKRLAAIREFTDLGAGFRIAARDLEIRGAGNLLGAEQSGHIGAVGIETYLKMLDETVRELRGEVVEEAPSAALDLPVPLAIPEEYVTDANLRMEIYRNIASVERDEAEVLAELTDRFGPPPPEVATLLQVASVKRLAESLRVQAVSHRGSTLTLRLRQDARVDVDRLIRMVETRPGATFSPTGVLTVKPVPPGESLAVARGVLEELAA